MEYTLFSTSVSVDYMIPGKRAGETGEPHRTPYSWEGHVSPSEGASDDRIRDARNAGDSSSTAAARLSTREVAAFFEHSHWPDNNGGRPQAHAMIGLRDVDGENR